MKTTLNYFGFLLLLISIRLNAQDTITINNGDLMSGTYNWTSDNIYLLDGQVTLEGGVLDIEAGTTVIALAKPSVDSLGTSALIISEGAILNATGTKQAPIIFTVDSLAWGGIRILGAEGNTSGSLIYISIRGAGRGDGQNIGSALTLHMVDQSTTVHHVEVYNSKGDGIRIHGGDVNIAFAAVSYVVDDAFDYDLGWSGNGIFWYANGLGTYTENPLMEKYGSFAIEGKSFIDDTDTLISNPVIYHATLVGVNCGDNFSSPKGAVGFFNNSQGRFVNSVFLHFPDYGIYVEDLPGKGDSYAAIENGHLLLEANVWHNFGRGIGSQAGNEFASGPGGLILTDDMTENPEAQSVVHHLIDHFNLISSSGMIKNLSGSCIAIDPRLNPNNDYSTYPNSNFPDNPFFNGFNAQTEKGAFASDLWVSEWTALDQLDTIIRLGEEGYGSYLYKGVPLTQADTIIISCEELPILQDSLIFVFPCRPFLYQLGAAQRKGNPRRSRPTNRSDEEEYAFIERWEYFSASNSCSAIRELQLTVLVLDTIAPTIHPVPDGQGGLTAITEDCDDSWITATEIDTIADDSSTITIRYTFFAEDYSGNQSTLSVDFKQDASTQPWYADLDRDGFGNPQVLIMATDSIAGFVKNSLDCNDSDPFIYPGSFGPDGKSGYNYDCDSFPARFDICSGALEIEPGTSCSVDFGDFGFSNPTIYPDLNGSCLPRNFNDVWVTTVLPISGGIHIQLREDFFNLVDPTGFNRIYMAEIYSGNCSQLVLEHCIIGDNPNLIYDFENTDLVGQELFIRIMEVGNVSYAPFEICILDLATKVQNDFCLTAQSLEVQNLDSCTMVTYSNNNAIDAPGTVTSSCATRFSPSDVWFKFITPEADSFQFAFNPAEGSDFKKPVVIFYSGDCGQMTELSCINSEEGAAFSRWFKDFAPGEELFIRIFDDLYRQGDFNLSLCYSPQGSVGILNRSVQDRIILYPNPGSVKQPINIDIESIGISWNWIDILDIQGRLVNRFYKSENTTDKTLFTLQPAALRSGLYFVHLKTEFGSITKKLILMD